ncbi:MAG TPA: OprD family outer membrane porin, partial [Sulfurovum sp.]|nr:OprD family outer membrane porin [Sulfurovum sp.]
KGGRMLCVFGGRFERYAQYVNAFNDTDSTWGYFEQEKRGAYFNIANFTATYEGTTLVAGRQLMATPMIQGYDWLLAPASFEAYTLTNSSIENVTLTGSYLTKVRENNSGDFDANLDGDNFIVGAAYDNKTINGSVWYYNVDAVTAYNPDKYGQIYADLGYNFGSFKVDGQYAGTDYDVATDAIAFGLMASTTLSGFDLSASYNYLADNATGFVSWNGLYTNQWNSTVATQFVGVDGDSINAFKVAASTTISDISVDLSYASWDNDFYEGDVILGYEFTKSIDAGIVYSNTQSAIWLPDTGVNQLEVYANYKF